MGRARALNMPNNLLVRYLRAKEAVIEAGYSLEIEWQDNIEFEKITEKDFLREAAWVVLSSGMREAVVRKKFPMLSTAFFEWESAGKITEQSEQCRRNALICFAHKGKINAILSIAGHIYNNGFRSVHEAISAEGISYILRFPYMGPATSFHFAKNIGLPFAKPDRHLVRMAQSLNYPSPKALCSEISDLIGDKISVVDIVLWRYATLYGDSF